MYESLIEDDGTKKMENREIKDMFNPVVEMAVKKIMSTEITLIQPEVTPMLNLLFVFSQNEHLAEVFNKKFN